jgi:LPS-assembly protein
LAFVSVIWIASAFPALARAQANPYSECKSWNVIKAYFTNDLVAGSDTVHETKLFGSADIPLRIDCDDMTLYADQIHWRDDSDIVYAEGNVVFQERSTHILAERAEMNRKTHFGTFFNTSGVLQLTNGKLDKSLFGTQEPDAMFAAARLEKVAERTYRLTNGSFTTCLQPTPRWEMATSTAVLTIDEHALIKNMVFKVKDVPLFYFPAIYYPINHDERSTGFLLPSYGSSSVTGFKLSNAFFWAIDRSQDATFYYDYLSKIGQNYGGEYRYVEAPGSNGTGRIYIMNRKEQLGADGTTVVTPSARAYNVVSRVSQGLPDNIRVLANVNYFSSVSAQQLLQQNIEDITQRTRTVGGQAYGTWGRYRLSGQMNVTDYFSGTTNAQRQGVAPDINFNVAEKPIGQSLVYFGLGSDFASFIRTTDINAPTTALGLVRLDLNPTMHVPLSQWPFLTVTTSASWRFTQWSQSYVDGVQEAVPLTRQIITLGARVTGPTFTRIFNTPDSSYAEKLKHVIEPNFAISRVTPFEDFAKVVIIDPIDQIVGGVTQIDYGITNRLLARTKSAAGPSGAVREILSVDLGQTYYSDQAAAAYDQQYQSSQGTVPVSNFSPIRLVANARPTDVASAQFRLEYDHQFSALRTIGANGTVGSRAVQLTAGWSKRFVIPELVGFSEPYATHSLFASTTIKRPDGHFGGTWSWNWDIQRDVLLQDRIVGFYNSQCCGLIVEYQRINYGGAPIAGVSVDRRFNISFTLAGIGTFSNPLGSFLGK